MSPRWQPGRRVARCRADAMSSLVKEDLAKRLFGPRRLRLQEFIEVEGSGAERCYLCAAGTGLPAVGAGRGVRGAGRLRAARRRLCLLALSGLLFAAPS